MAKHVANTDDTIRNIELNVNLEKKENETEIFENMRSFVINPTNAVSLVPHLTERIPFSTSSEKLEEIIDIICEKVVNPPTERGVNIAAYAAFCKGFGDLKVTKEVKGFRRVVSFQEILADNMVDKLEERFSYKERLLEQMKILPLPEEKKRRWLEQQTEKQKRNLRSTALFSVEFMKQTHTDNSETVYKVMDFLLANAEEPHIEYLCHLLKTMGRNLDAEIARRHRVEKPTARHFLNDNRLKLNNIFRKISLLAMGNPSISTRLRTTIQDLIKLRQAGWKTSEDKVSVERAKSSTSSSYTYFK